MFFAFKSNTGKCGKYRISYIASDKFHKERFFPPFFLWNEISHGLSNFYLSDPRAILLRERARDLAIEKGKIEEFELYELVEKLAPPTFAEYKGNGPDQQTCINVDFYSGFVYSCIGVPKELFTPLFAMARVAGWCTHRIEELTFSAKRIIRPSYKNVYPMQEYIPIMERL